MRKKQVRAALVTVLAGLAALGLAGLQPGAAAASTAPSATAKSWLPSTPAELAAGGRRKQHAGPDDHIRRHRVFADHRHGGGPPAHAGAERRPRQPERTGQGRRGRQRSDRPGRRDRGLDGHPHRSGGRHQRRLLRHQRDRPAHRRFGRRRRDPQKPADRIQRRAVRAGQRHHDDRSAELLGDDHRRHRERAADLGQHPVRRRGRQGHRGHLRPRQHRSERCRPPRPWSPGP